jgi:hypothetical protein
MLAVGLFIILSFLSVSPEIFGIGYIFEYLDLLNSRITAGLIVGLNFISIIPILIYFINKKNSRKKVKIRQYIQVGVAVFIMKFISGFIAFGQVVCTWNHNSQAISYFYYTFIESHGINPKAALYTDPMTAGIIVAFVGIMIVIAMVVVAMILDNEEGSNTIWLGVLHK